MMAVARIKNSDSKTNLNKSYLKALTKILQNDLDFHDLSSNYSSHNFHSFPAKFPPQLPQKFILNLTQENDIVLDPMVGSGTTILEGLFANRKTIGFDIDPLALMIAQVKSTFYNKKQLIDSYNNIISSATSFLQNSETLLSNYNSTYDDETKKFFEYWFLKDSILELFALSNSISSITNKKVQTFFRIIFSSIIITKNGGVSLALDLAHTRPHRVKKVYNFNSDLVFDLGDYEDNPRHHLLTKKMKSPINEFKKKFLQNIDCVVQKEFINKPIFELADSQNLPLPDNFVDLIVTSPPYASNAIDYMRAHKFSLLWFGYSVNELKEKRNNYIGGESTSNFNFENMPAFTSEIIKKLKKKNPKKALVLYRYYSEMTRSLREMYRVLKPNKAAIVVVGNSTLNGIISETHLCLKEIGENIGFCVPHICVRNLDRNRRMMPATLKNEQSSQILNRMNEEYVIGFYKK